MTTVRNLCKKIVAVGRNYRDHALELNNPVPSTPIIFMKPGSSIITECENIKVPYDSEEVAHEVELGIVIGNTLSNVSEEDALKSIMGYVVALDMTDRNLQNNLKGKGLPWTLAKCFDTSCPISDFIDKSCIPNPQDVELWLEVNGKTRQKCRTDQMIFSPEFLISFISRRIKLEKYDLILTGTPAGVGPVHRGDKIACGITGLVTCNFSVE